MNAIDCEQVAFDLQIGLARDTDWGQLRAHPDRLRQLAQGTGYLNAFVRTSWLREPAWVVENLSIPAEATSPTGRYIDLMPGIVGKGRVSTVQMTVLYSTKPLANTKATVAMAAARATHTFPVAQVVHNAEGDWEPEDREPPKYPARVRGAGLVADQWPPPGSALDSSSTAVLVLDRRVPDRIAGVEAP
jgi:hypothetical protein